MKCTIRFILLVAALLVLATNAHAQFGYRFTNNEGSQVTKWAVVIFDTSVDSSFKLPTADNNAGVVGILQADTANAAQGIVFLPGSVAKCYIDGSVTRGDTLITSTTTKGRGKTGTGNVFALALESGTDGELIQIALYSNISTTGFVAGTGTVDTVIKWGTSSTAVDSNITDDGSTITLDSAVIVTGDTSIKENLNLLNAKWIAFELTTGAPRNILSLNEFDDTLLQTRPQSFIRLGDVTNPSILVVNASDNKVTLSDALDVGGDMEVGGDDIDFTHATPTTDIGGGTGTWTINGNVTVQDILQIDQQISMAEISTPTPVANYGALYWKPDNGLYGQDGAGDEHLIHASAFSELGDHKGADGSTNLSIVLTNANEFYKLVGYQNIGEEDHLGNVTASLSTDDITVGANAAGRYDMKVHGSMTVAGGADQNIIVVHGVELGSPKVITAATAASPIVITIVGHGLLNGDMVTISGMPGGEVDEANGHWIVTNKTDDVFGLVSLGGSSSSGTGTYTTGGTVDIFYDYGCISHSAVSGNDFDPLASSCKAALVATDKVAVYLANTTSSGKTVNFAAVNFGIERFSD